jgi:hypothetical protein
VNEVKDMNEVKEVKEMNVAKEVKSRTEKDYKRTHRPP